MRRTLLALSAAALAAACGDSQTPAPTASLRQPAAIAAFTGRTSAAPGTLAPYFAVANATRNDLTLVDANTDAPVLAPVRLEALRVHLDRPALLASASLGDGLADLLVAVSAGDTALQLVRTWTAENAVVESLDLGADVVAIAALPATAPGTARLAVALAGRQLAVVEYERAPKARPEDPQPEGIVVQGVTVGELGFQPEALAAIPAGVALAGDENVVYAASLEPVPDAGGALGVGVVELATPPAPGGAWIARGLDARAPTRLVAATRLRERAATHAPAADPATDIAPFDGQLEEERVYAVLDESACGVTQPIDCGVAILDPARGLLPDPTGRMPYLAPIQLAGRPLALAVAGPPAKGPPDAPAEAPYAGEAPAFMRLWPASGPVATTAVGAVALESPPSSSSSQPSGGAVVFLDLGRWKVADDAAAAAPPTVTAQSGFRDLPVAVGTPALQQRLWLKSQGAVAADPFLASDQVATGVTVTRGFTRRDTFSVTHQGVLPSLLERRAEAGLLAPGQVWLALQTSEPDGAGRRFLQRVEIGDPGLGVRAGPADVGDIVQVQFEASLLPACLAGLEAPAVGTTERLFEARAAQVLPPDAARFPGGALLLEKEGDGGAFDLCHDELAAAIATAPGEVQTGLLATIRARGLVLTSTALGYAGRPVLGVPFALEYPAVNEDDPSLVGEDLVLARKARPHHHVSDACAGPDPARPCTLTAGPVIGFQVDLELSRPLLEGEAPPQRPLRDTVLQLATASGVVPFSARPGTGLGSHPTGAIAFDRSLVAGGSPGYRFLVPYASSVVLDAGPANQGANPGLIR